MPAMNLQIINGCAGIDHGSPTAGTNSGRSYWLFIKGTLSFKCTGENKDDLKWSKLDNHAWKN